MHKSILIHFNNTPLSVQKLFSDKNIINFNCQSSNYSNLDEYISKEIIAELKKREFDLIYQRFSLSQLP